MLPLTEQQKGVDEEQSDARAADRRFDGWLAVSGLAPRISSLTFHPSGCFVCLASGMGMEAWFRNPVV